MADEITVYGSDWCGYTIRLVRELQRLDVPFSYVEVEDDSEAERKIAAWNNGRSIRPTVQFGERIWVNPDPQEVRSAYDKQQATAQT